MTRCGCGRLAEYEVYEHREPHCKACMLEAIDCSVPVLVRVHDEYDLDVYRRDEQRRLNWECDKAIKEAV